MNKCKNKIKYKNMSETIMLIITYVITCEINFLQNLEGNIFFKRKKHGPSKFYLVKQRVLYLTNVSDF